MEHTTTVTPQRKRASRSPPQTPFRACSRYGPTSVYPRHHTTREINLSGALPTSGVDGRTSSPNENPATTTSELIMSSVQCSVTVIFACWPFSCSGSRPETEQHMKKRSEWYTAAAVCIRQSTLEFLEVINFRMEFQDSCTCSDNRGAPVFFPGSYQ